MNDNYFSVNVECLTLNTPNANNRVYTKEVVEKAILDIQKDIDNTRFLLFRNQPTSATVNLEDVVGVVKNMCIKGDSLLADINILSLGEDVLAPIKSKELSVRTAGMGVVGEDGIVRDYKLFAVFLTDDPA